MAHFTLHAVGTNRPGIVAAVTTAIAAQGWDIGDSAMTLLEGQFAIVLALDPGPISDGRVIEEALSHLVDEVGLFISVRPIEAVPPPFVGASTIELAVSGANKPGIVAGVAEVLAAAGADIGRLDSQLVEREGDREYVMRIGATLPASISRGVLEASLLERAANLGISCSITPHEG